MSHDERCERVTITQSPPLTVSEYDMGCHCAARALAVAQEEITRLGEAIGRERDALKAQVEQLTAALREARTYAVHTDAGFTISGDVHYLNCKGCSLEQAVDEALSSPTPEGGIAT